MPRITSAVSRSGSTLDAARVHALAGELLEDEAAHVLVAHPRDDRGFEPQPRRAAGDVRRRAADVLRERAHVLEAPADLSPVEIHRRPADGDEVECLHPANSSSQKPACAKKGAAGRKVRENAAGVAWVAFLLDGDVTAVADFREQLADSDIVDPSAADGAHDSLRASVEEADAALHDICVDRVVDVLEVDVVRAVGVTPDCLDRVHPGIVQMASVEAEPGELDRHVAGNPVKLVLELDIAAGMRMDDRPDAVAVARDLRDRADVVDHAGPGLGIETRGAFGVSGGVVAFVVAPVHYRQVWCLIALPRMALRLR